MVYGSTSLPAAASVKSTRRKGLLALARGLIRAQRSWSMGMLASGHSTLPTCSSIPHPVCSPSGAAARKGGPRPAMANTAPTPVAIVTHPRARAKRLALARRVCGGCVRTGWPADNRGGASPDFEGAFRTVTADPSRAYWGGARPRRRRRCAP
jgi:hypothetical protein